MKKKEKFRVISPVQDNFLSLFSVLTLIAGTLAVVGLILWLLARGGLIELGRFSRPAPDTPEAGLDAPSVYDILREEAEDAEDSPEIHRFSGDFSTLRALLADAAPDPSYYMETETALYHEKEEIRTSVRIWKDGSAFRIHRQTPGQPDELYISDGHTVSYTDGMTGAVRFFPSSETFSVEALAGIPSVASFSAVPTEQIDYASYTEIGGRLVYYIRFHETDPFGKTLSQEYWISPDAELVIRCRTYGGSHTGPDIPAVYASRMRTFRPLEEREKATCFLLPNPTE